MNNTCIICEKPVPDYTPVMCCSGHECGCMGQPTEPCVCSKECDSAVYDNIGMTMEERRIKAGIEKWSPSGVTIGWMCFCWCDTYWEPEGVVMLSFNNPPEVGKAVKLSDGKEWTITSVNPNEFEIKVERP